MQGIKLRRNFSGDTFSSTCRPRSDSVRDWFVQNCFAIGLLDLGTKGYFGAKFARLRLVSQTIAQVSFLALNSSCMVHGLTDYVTKLMWMRSHVMNRYCSTILLHSLYASAAVLHSLYMRKQALLLNISPQKGYLFSRYISAKMRAKMPKYKPPPDAA